MNIEWIKGKPEKLVPGMLVILRTGKIGEALEVVGDQNTQRGYCSCCSSDDEILEYSTSLVPVIAAEAERWMR